jgi:hypothetical protein
MSDLKLRKIPVNFLDGATAEGHAEGNNAAWICQCSYVIPLLGRCFPPRNPPDTVCPICHRRYSLKASDRKPVSVEEELSEPEQHLS